MSRQLRNWAVVVALLWGVGSAGVWLMLHTRIQLAFWDRISRRALDDQERTALARCESPGWWTWLKVVRHDLVLSCGEAWGARALADRVGGPDRAAWLAVRAADPQAPTSVRLRAAMALTLDRRDTPVEPAWLWMELPPDAFARWVGAVGQSEEIATHLGPAGLALSHAVGLKHGRLSVGEALPALHWLASVGDPTADAWVVSAARTSLSAPSDFASLARSTRRVAGAPASWSGAADAFADCEAPCAGAWVALLEADGTAAALESGQPMTPEPLEFEALSALEDGAATPGTERRGLAFASRALAAWTRAGRRPAARLATFFARPIRPTPTARLYWDGVGLPFHATVVSAVVAQELAIPTEVRVGVEGQVWIRFGPESSSLWAARTCSTGAGPLPSSAWPWESVVAAAFAERATSRFEEGHAAVAARLATRAALLDGVVAAAVLTRTETPATEDHALGRRIGAALVTPSTDTQLARDSRQRIGDGQARCTSR